MSSELVILKDFLDHLAEKEKKSLESYLSDEKKEDLQAIIPSSFSPSEGLFTNEERLSFIHYTWWLFFLDPLSDQDKYLFIGALSSGVQDQLLSHYSLTRSDITLTSFAKPFFQETLYHHLTKSTPGLLLIECLPKHPLNELLFLSREQLLSLIDLLSVHDLSIEIKTLISASHLTKVFELLSEKQKGYYQLIRQKKEPLSFTPMGISRWGGDPHHLKKVLHQRGLNRLAKALSVCHSSMVWHLLHKLDIGRSASVQALIKDLKNKKAHDFLVLQVCEIMNALSA